MSSFDDAFVAADQSSFDVMGSQDGLILLVSGASPNPIPVIEQPSNDKNVFTQGGRFNDSSNVLEVMASDLINNGIKNDGSSDGFICQRKGKQYRCTGIFWEGGTATITLEPNVNRRGS